MSPSVSILIPTYEPNPAHLAEALRSLQSQTFQDWTAFIHDDASTVDVRSMLREAMKDPRIVFERSERRLGIGGNWNACLNRATAPYVQFLFQDDVWMSAYLETCVQAMERNPTVALLSANHDYRFEDGNLSGIYTEATAVRSSQQPGKHVGTDILSEWLLKGLKPNFVGEPSFVMLRREAGERAGTFLEDMPQFLDTEYWTRMLQQGDWYFIPESLGFFRVHAKSASAANEQTGEGLFDRFRTMQRLIARLPAGPLKSAARRGRDASMQAMIEKFFARRRTPATRAVGAVPRLGLYDRWILAVALARYLLRRGSETFLTHWGKRTTKQLRKQSDQVTLLP